MPLDEALDALSDVEPDEFASALSEQKSPFFKAIRNPAYEEGKRTGKAEAEKDTESARDKIAALRKEKKSLQDKLETLENDKPEAAKIQGEYEEKLKQKQKRIADLESKLDETEENWRGKAKSVRKSATKERIASAWKAMGVDPDYADFQAEKIMNSGRVQVADDESLSTQFYEDDDGMTPFHHSGDGPVDQAFAAEYAENFPDKFIDRKGPSSTGLGNTNGVGGAKKMRRRQFEGLGPAEQRSFIQDGGEVVN